MRRWGRRIAVVLLVAAAAVALRLTVLAPEPVPVEVAEVDRGAVESTVTNSRAGSVRARRRAKLSPEIGGQVIELPFREGDRVRRGDVLLRLDDRSQRARLELARRDVEAAEAERSRACLAAERSARELQRVERLAGEEIVSADLLDQVASGRATAEATCQAATANAARAAAAAEVSRTELAKTVLHAPFEGLVAEIAVELGEWTTPSPPALPVPPVIDVLDPASIYVSAPMDEVDSARMAVGLTARVTVDSHRDRAFTGRVARVAPYVLDLQEQNRTVEIEVELDDSALEAGLLPGTSADVEVILELHDDALRIPTTALMEGGRVLVVDGERLAERSVTTGLSNWDQTEILDGLAAGDRVVVSLDRSEVRDGAEVEVVEDLDAL